MLPSAWPPVRGRLFLLLLLCLLGCYGYRVQPDRESPAAAGPPTAEVERPTSAAAVRPPAVEAERSPATEAERPPTVAAERPPTAAAEQPTTAEAERPTSAKVEPPTPEKEYVVTHRDLERLCTDEVVADGDLVLGQTSGLSELLFLDLEQLDTLLDGLKLFERRNYTGRELCEAAVLAIPRVLRVSVPRAPSEACTSADCEKVVDVSPQQLREEAQDKVEEEKEELKPDEINVTDDSIVPMLPVVDLPVMLRRLLAIMFRFYPSLNVEDSALSEPEDVETPSGESSLLEKPIYGSLIRQDRRALFDMYSAQAHAWITEAIRKLPNSQRYIERWFNTHNKKTIQKQMTLTRHLLSLTLDIYANLKVVRGDSCSPGVTAYVVVSGDNTARMFTSCGHRDPATQRYEINICDEYFSAGRDFTHRTHTFVHESTHHFGTDDIGYCWHGDCSSLTYRQASENADSYAHFVKDLVSDASISGEGKPSRPPCRDGDPGYKNSKGKVTCAMLKDDQRSGCDGQDMESRAWTRTVCLVSCGLCGDRPIEDDPVDSGSSGVGSGGGGGGGGGYGRGGGRGGRRGGRGFWCFPPSAQVHVADPVHHGRWEARSLDELRPGDVVAGSRAGGAAFVRSFHSEAEGSRSALVPYLRVRHARQVPGRPLLVTANHFVFVGSSLSAKELLPAGDLRPGHSLLSMGEGGQLEPSIVEAVDEVVLVGFSGPLTTTGDLLVEGVLVSSFGFATQRQLDFWRGWPAHVRAYTQEIAWLLTLPYRAALVLGADVGHAYLDGLMGVVDRFQVALVYTKLSLFV